MNIKSVRLVNGGYKGIEVVYLKEEEKNGRTVVNEVKEKRRHPVHSGLEIPFKDLRYYLLHICELLGDEDEVEKKDRLMESCDVVEVKMDAGVFVLKGDKEVFVSGKRFKLESPKLEEDDSYEHYEVVKNIVERIVEETEHYLKGAVKVTEDELVIRWIGAGKNKEFDIDSFNALPMEEKKRISMEFLEKEVGYAVLSNDEVEVDEGSDSIELGDLDKVAISIPSK